MAINRYLIDTIRKKYKITTYLASKGFEPARKHENRISYLCPLHKEQIPSFMVFLNPGEYESYFCFGCKKYGDLISLYAALESTDWKTAIGILGEGIEVTDVHKLNVTVEELKAELLSTGIEQANVLFGEISLQIASMGAEHLKRTAYDSEERNFLESLYRIIDRVVANFDIETLSDIYQFLLGENPLHCNAFLHRMMDWDQRQEEKLRAKLMAGRNN